VQSQRTINPQEETIKLEKHYAPVSTLATPQDMGVFFGSTTESLSSQLTVYVRLSKPEVEVG
jgi:hypothetical protein